MNKAIIISFILAGVFSGCIKVDSTLDSTKGGEILFDTPVTSAMMKSVPGPILDALYPENESMGIIAVHSTEAPGSWSNPAAVKTNYINDAEFKSINSGLWAGWDAVNNERHPYYWPKSGSLIFAGYSPYRRLDMNQNPTKVQNVNFDHASRQFTITDYAVGKYIPMTKDEIERDDFEYSNVSQSDLMIFMPGVDGDGNYIGISDLPSCDINFRHALALVEFTVKAEEEYDIDRIDINSIVIDHVYHMGDLVATLGDDGQISIDWPESALERTDNMVVFDADPGENTDAKGLTLFLEPRTIAEILIIPGPAHPIDVKTHIYMHGDAHSQIVTVTPEEIGVTRWEAGKRYVYHITLNVNKMTFSSTVDEWSTSNGGVTVQ